MYGYGYAFIIFYFFMLIYMILNKVNLYNFLLKYKYQIIILLILFLYPLIINFNWQNFYYNVIQLLIPGICIPFSIYNLLISKDKAFLERFYKIFIKFCNIYFIINIVIIFLQFNESYFLIRRIDGGNNFYLDHITGLIGLSGTHILSFFWIMLLIINSYEIIHKRNIKLGVLTFIDLNFMFYISSQNDNKFFYILFVIFLCIFLFVYFYKMIIQYKYYVLISLLFSIVLSVVLLSLLKYYDILPSFISTVLDSIYNYCNSIITANFSQSTERFMLIDYSLKNNNNILFGSGFGSIVMLYPKEFPLHFGMNDLSSLLYVCGLIPTGILIMLYTKLMCMNFPQIPLILKLFIFLITMLMFIYTNIITVTANSILYFLCFFYLGKIWRIKYETKICKTSKKIN